MIFAFIHRLRRRSLACGQTALLVLSLAALGGCDRQKSSADIANGSSSAAPVKLVLQTDWLPVPEHGGYYQAMVKGFYRDAGLDMEITPGGPSTYTYQRVATGQCQLGMGRSDDVIQAVGQGLPIIIICALMEHDAQAIMVHADDPARSLQDLDGRAVMASPGAAYVAYLERRHHIKINIVPLDYGLSRFLANPRAIQQCFVSSEPFFVKQQGVATRVMLVAEGGYDPYRVIFANASFVRAHPEAIRAFVAASIKGWDDFLDGDSAAARAEISLRNKSMTPALMDFSINALKQYHLVKGDPAKNERTGLITPARLREQMNLLVDLGIIPEAIPLEKFVTFAFLPADLQALAR